MKSIDFLTQKLTELYVLHPYLEIKYEFRNYIDTHIIEVRPLYDFENDVEFIKKQIELEYLFEDKFPGEEIVFLSESKLISIENPIISLGGIQAISCMKVVGSEAVVSSPQTSYEEVIKYFASNLESNYNDYLQYSNFKILIDNELEVFSALKTSRLNVKKEKPISWYNMLDFLDLKKDKDKKEETKKDSELLSESFFLLLLQYGKRGSSNCI
ncbi:MAG: hypothetical protein BGO88_07130 [Flavobacterium sp. 38-13]|uniref:hypothetical protein n=1 Tax=Flavobacterium sp. 38-13 TaxID=1896168 RepID=UPI00096426E8|nr:hypothetical protein [Flavobacterium sp. 38-13]OJX50962.1 MAG: hypothetical protein BGO88_07130 [Flavobacterium sp. 38-13]